MKIKKNEKETLLSVIRGNRGSMQYNDAMIQCNDEDDNKLDEIPINLVFSLLVFCSLVFCPLVFFPHTVMTMMMIRAVLSSYRPSGIEHTSGFRLKTDGNHVDQN